MALNISTPWHRESYDRFISERLPELLADRLPLSGYQAECDEYVCRLKVIVGDVEMAYEIMRPDDWGVFQVRDSHKVILPVASSEYLDTAEIKCVGEQFLDYISERLGEAPRDMVFDEALVRSWLPLDTWVAEAVEEIGQWLDKTDTLTRITHSRRLLIPTREKLITASHFGRVCPFNTPEGPNVGMVLDIAVGAQIIDGKLVIVDSRPESALGMVASMLPFLEHDDSTRILMGVNMVRQWVTPPDPEPALVQTGNEFSAPGFWCGRNLLTAYVSWGRDTFEDGLLISESAAKRLDFPRPLEPGDKLSNRHGAKGCVSRIVPDDEMPHLPDGTPVELVYNFIALHTRLIPGSVLEAVAGRIARVEGTPFIAPPFRAPKADGIRERLVRAGLPEDGMEVLTLGKDGRKLDRPSTVGWVYWGKTAHLAHDKIHWATRPGESCTRQGELEYYAMRDVGASEMIREQFNTRSAEREGAETFAERVASGPVEQAGPPTPDFEDVAERLAAGGIRVELSDGRVAFRFAPPEGEVLKLACPVPHPWIPERMVQEIGGAPEGMTRIPDLGMVYPGSYPGSPTGPGIPATLVEANTKMARMISTNAPESLKQRAYADLQSAVRTYFDELLTPNHMRLGQRILFSGRTVLAPGVGLRTDQLGVADDMAWALFGPLVGREMYMSEVEARSERAAQALDAIMARSWVLLNRAPTFMTTSLLAFHPVRTGDRTLRLHPLACMLMNGDFDGDQAALFLPITEAGQSEAGEKLSIAGHLRRDPSLVRLIYPRHEALWGLAELSRTDLAQIEQIAGTTIGAPEGFVTADTIIAALTTIMERDGIDRMLEVSERLFDLGMQVVKESGASLSPFVGESLHRPEKPAGDDPVEWQKYSAAIEEALGAWTDFDSSDLGPQMLAVKSRARGNMRWMVRLVDSTGVEKDINGAQVPIRHGLSEGLTPEDMFALVPSAREGLGEITLEVVRGAYGVREYKEPSGFNVLDRAMRAKYPGIVFADAAANGEVDPLTSIDARLFVGI